MFSCMLSSSCGLLCVIAGYPQPSAWYFTYCTTSENSLSSLVVKGLNSQVTGELFCNQANFFAFRWEVYRESPRFELVIFSLMKQVFSKSDVSLGHYNSVLCPQKTKDIMPLLHIFQMFCCAKTRQNLQQGYHCQLIVQKNKFLSYMWSSFPFKLLFLNHLRKSTFFNDIFVRDTHTQAIKHWKHCVTAMPSTPKPALHV